MNVLVVGKPKYNVILEVLNYPKENSKLGVNEKLEITGGKSVYVACMLAKWGINVSYAGTIAGDEIGNKIKSEIESYGVDTKYLEVNYEVKSNINYVILNKENGSSTEVEHLNNNFAQKYKYDTIFDYVITDGSDIGLAMAIANNYPTSKIILLANKVNDEIYNLSKRSIYVCANVNFAEALTKLKYEFNRPKSLVSFYQKIKDLNKASYILMLRDKGVLYAKERQVKMIPAIPIEKILDDANSGSAFFAAYVYGIINNYDMDEVAKIANIAGGLALTKVGSLKTIPEKSDIYNMAGFKEGEGVKKLVKMEVPNNVQPNPVVQNNNQTPVSPVNNNKQINNEVISPNVSNTVTQNNSNLANESGIINTNSVVTNNQTINNNVEGATNQNVQ